MLTKEDFIKAGYKLEDEFKDDYTVEKIFQRQDYVEKGSVEIIEVPWYCVRVSYDCGGGADFPEKLMATGYFTCDNGAGRMDVGITLPKNWSIADLYWHFAKIATNLDYITDYKE